MLPSLYGHTTIWLQWAARNTLHDFLILENREKGENREDASELQSSNWWVTCLPKKARIGKVLKSDRGDVKGEGKQGIAEMANEISKTQVMEKSNIFRKIIHKEIPAKILWGW